jgi:formylglycine-generating enzyme required for sulfatase activity
MLGLCDMHGNVFQYCADLWDSQQQGSDRVVRGGSWGSFGSDCRAAIRYGGAPAYRFYNLGLRLTRVPRPATGPAGQSDRPRNP